MSSFETEIKKKIAGLEQAALRLPSAAPDQTLAALFKMQGQLTAYNDALAIFKRITNTDMDESDRPVIGQAA